MRTAILAASLILAGCGDRQPEAEPRPVAPANPMAAVPDPTPAALNHARAGEQILRTDYVTAVFTGWEVGDHAWAHLRADSGDEIAAQTIGAPIDPFLTEHRDMPLGLTLQTIRVFVPEAGAEQEIVRIVDASANGTSAAAWWAALAPGGRAAAQAAAEAAMVPA